MYYWYMFQYNQQCYVAIINRVQQNIIFVQIMFQPDEFKSGLMKITSKRLSYKAVDLKRIGKFQQSVVKEWNPLSIKAASLMIPLVSMRDEIITDGHGMALIEIVCLPGVLIKIEHGDNKSTWGLAENRNEKYVYMCMDGLSLDRH